MQEIKDQESTASKRWSARRKAEIVLRLFRGESIDDVSRDIGIEVSIVAELKRTLGPISKDVVMEFLKYQNIMEYFDELITPQGKVNIRNDTVDPKYIGKSKEEGTLYDVLVEDLAIRGIQPVEAAMVGDKEWSDIAPAKKRGFNTILYTGYINRGPTTADYVIRHFSELQNIIISK